MAFNSQTKSRRLHASNAARARLAMEEAETQARIEFLEGTRVRWIYTFKGGDPVYREGIVSKPDGYWNRGEWVVSRTTKVNVTMATGRIHSLHASDLEIWYDEVMGLPSSA